ncbi:MAG TPA: glycosyltransferase [Pyrinomonadaceae bacterium]|nr:glycosyltransferase [Pyrinomonadaceae bacterium]
MTTIRPVRVLHIIDTLGGGGSERLVWDIVRLSDPARVQHRVVTIFPDGYLVPFVYAEPLRELGAYRGSQDANAQSRQGGSKSPGDFASLRLGVKNLPRALKNPLVHTWNSGFSLWRELKHIGVHLRSTLSVPAEYFRFKPDVVHTHGFYGFKYGLLFRRPTVHIVPALFAQMEAQGTGWLVNRYRRFHRHVDCFALDAGYRNELLSIGVPPHKLLLIEGTLDLEAITAVRSERERHRREVRQRLGIPEDALIALSVGRLDPSKGHSYALEALPAILKQFPNLHWIVLGEGEHRRELEKLIDELGVAPHAHLIGFDPQPLPYYAAADVYLRTTTMEGENISSRQAIAMGLPAVGFDTCCETDLIAKLGHGILVPNADAAALAAATWQILSIPDRGAAMGARGIDYCKTHMGIQKHVDDLMSLYTQLKRTHPVNPENPVILSNN